MDYLVVSATRRKVWWEGTGQHAYRTVFLVYEGVSKSFQTELITKYMLTFGNTH